MVATDPDTPIKPRDTSRGMVIHDDNILLMERWRPGKHYFSIPGGGIETGETPEQTVVREIFEETNLNIEAERLVLIMKDKDITHRIYICKYLSGQPELTDDAPEALHMTPDNQFKPGWVPIHTLKDLSYNYWQPLKGHIIKGAQNGFAAEPVTVTITD